MFPLHIDEGTGHALQTLLSMPGNSGCKQGAQLTPGSQLPNFFTGVLMMKKIHKCWYSVGVHKTVLETKMIVLSLSRVNKKHAFNRNSIKFYLSQVSWVFYLTVSSFQVE